MWHKLNPTNRHDATRRHEQPDDTSKPVTTDYYRSGIGEHEARSFIPHLDYLFISGTN
jgi:hypothetical protein